MLTDPFVLRAPDLAAHTAVTNLFGLSLARTQEQSGSASYGPTSSGSFGDVSMKISHSVSNENKPWKTNRVLLRTDFAGFRADGGRSAAFAYAVFGLPETGVYSSVANAISNTSGLTAAQMAAFLVGAIGVNDTAWTLLESRIARLLAGEA